MRLWHQSMLGILPDNQLASQHRECCALRGKGWGKKHSTVDYVFTHPIEKLVGYHLVVMNEMKRRGKWDLEQLWYNPQYRGKELGLDTSIDSGAALLHMIQPLIYSEHNAEYFTECLDNVIAKLKVKLIKYVERYGLSDPQTYVVSTDLDKLIVAYQKRAS